MLVDIRAGSEVHATTPDARASAFAALGPRRPRGPAGPRGPIARSPPRRFLTARDVSFHSGIE